MGKLARSGVIGGDIRIANVVPRGELRNRLMIRSSKAVRKANRKELRTASHSSGNVTVRNTAKGWPAKFAAACSRRMYNDEIASPTLIGGAQSHWRNCRTRSVCNLSRFAPPCAQWRMSGRGHGTWSSTICLNDPRRLDVDDRGRHVAESPSLTPPSPPTP